MGRSLLSVPFVCVYFFFCWVTMPKFDVKAFVLASYVLLDYVWLLPLRSLLFSNKTEKGRQGGTERIKGGKTISR